MKKRKRLTRKALHRANVKKRRGQQVAEFRAMRAEYRNWLRGPEWAAVRELFAVDHPPICAACGSETGLHLHHLRYADPPKDTPFSDLMWLCATPCHVIADHLRRQKLVAPRPADVVRAIRRRLTNTVQPPIPHPLDRL